MSFLLPYVSGTRSQHDIADDANLGHLADAVLANFLHYEVNNIYVFSYSTLRKQVKKYMAHSGRWKAWLSSTSWRAEVFASIIWCQLFGAP